MKYILILLSVILLSSCTTKQEQKVVTVYEKQKIIKADKISPVFFDEVLFKKIVLNGINYIILEPSEYEKLLLNIEKLNKYIKEQNNVIEYYNSEAQ